MKKILALVLVLSVFAQASEKAPAPALPLPTSGNVTLPLAEYNKLVDLAGKAAKIHEQPPVPYTIKRAEVKLRAGNETVLGSLLLDGEVFSKSAAKVPLASGMTILNAHQEGKVLPLLEEGSTATAVLPGAGDFSVTLEAGLPLVIEAGRASFNLPVPAAGSVKLSLVIPGDHTNVRISPGLITSKTSANGQTTVEAALVPGQTASVWWATREIVAPVVPREVRLLSSMKTLVSVSEADLRIAALADITVVQGEPQQFVLTVPADFEITDVSGPTVEGSEIEGDKLTVHLNSGAPRNHQFLITMEKPLAGAAKIDAPFIALNDAQRETGEVLVEGAGAMELTATEGGSLKRMDVKEVDPYLRALARNPLQAAFRYHRQPQAASKEAPTLALAWTRFPDSSVLAAIAERAVVTTLVTSEGRSLTEVTLTVKNQAQPFLKVDLPADATIVSAEVAGERVKPVQGPDGNRVPLLRANFRPAGPYTVSFVFMHSGAPFAKKGGAELSLPSMDVPISLLQWEVFLPERYKVKNFGGDAIAMNLLPSGPYAQLLGKEFDKLETFALVAPRPGLTVPRPEGGPRLPGQLGGTVVDPQGAVIAGAHVKVTHLEKGITMAATTDAYGQWLVSGMPAGRVKIEAYATGFKTSVINVMVNDPSRPLDYGAMKLDVGNVTAVVEVTAEAPIVDRSMFRGGNERDEKKQLPQQASANVYNLQKKVAGVLPVRVDVPRAGASYSFVRPLVLDEETKLTFNYKTR